MKESIEKVVLGGEMNTQIKDNPGLRSGPAGRKKKSNSKWETVEVDKKALDKAIFIEKIDMFNSIWNKFEDPRGWIWVQEELK